MKCFFTLILATFSTLTFSQLANTQWAHCYGADGLDLFSSVEATADSGYILAGTSHVNGESDLYLVKTDRKGLITWEKRFGGAGFQFCYDMTLTHDGGYILVGEKFAPLWPYKSDFIIAKFNHKGNFLWEKVLGSENKDYAMNVTRCRAGGYFVAGCTSVMGYEDDLDIWVMKLDESGEIIWENIIGGTGTDYGPMAVKESEDGHLFGLGFTTSDNGDLSENKGNSDLWIFELDETGGVVWSETFGGSGSDWGKDLLLLDDGGMMILGQTNSTNGDVSAQGHGGEDFWLMKLDANRNIVWNKLYGGNSLEQPKTIVKATDGNGYLLVGDSWSDDFIDNYGYSDFLAIDVDKNGIIKEIKSWGGADSDDMTGQAIVTWDGNYAFAGTTYSANIAAFDIDVVGNHGYADGWLLKLGEKEIITEVELITMLYPNPTDDGCYIQLSEKCTDCMLNLYDIAGKIIIQKAIPVGTSYLHLDQLAAGIYPWKVSSNIDGIENTVGKLIVK